MANKYSHGNVLSHYSQIGVISLPNGIAARYSKQDGPEAYQEGVLGRAGSRTGMRPRSSIQEAPHKLVNDTRPHSLHQDMKFRNGVDLALINSYNRASSTQSRGLVKGGTTGKHTFTTTDTQDSPDETSMGTQKSSADQKMPELTSGGSSLDSSLAIGDIGQTHRRRQQLPTNPKKTTFQADPADEIPPSERIGAKIDRLRTVMVDGPQRSAPRLNEVTGSEISNLLRQTVLPRGPPPPSNVRGKDGVEVVENIRLSSQNTNGTPIANQEAKEVSQLDDTDIKPDFVPQRQASPPPAAGYEDTKHIEARAAEKHEPEIAPENVLIGPGHLPESGLVRSKKNSHKETSMAEPCIVPPDKSGTLTKENKRSNITSTVNKSDNAVDIEALDAVPPDVARFGSSVGTTELSRSRSRKKEIKETEKKLEELKALEKKREKGSGMLKKIKGPKLRRLRCI